MYGICDIGKYDLIWFDLIWLDIPNLTENNIHYGEDSFLCTADLQATSTFPFHFHFHVLDVSALENVIRRMSKYWDNNAYDFDDDDINKLLAMI